MRESNFELLRLIAQFMIVLLHIYGLIVYPMYHIPFERAITIPLHIGVPLFVLISGYFGIRIKGKSLSRLMGQMLVYTIPLQVCYSVLNSGGGVIELCKDFLFISNSPYWFMRTYLCLYLVSPMINSYIERIGLKERFFFLFCLLFISTYLGSLAQNDPTLYDGTNLTNFITLYVIGNTLRVYVKVWKNVSISTLTLIYILLNVAIVTIYCILVESMWGKLFYHLCWPYTSPILFINAIVLFMIVGKMKFKSNIINTLSTSSLSIYLIHYSKVVFCLVITPCALYLRAAVPNEFLFFIVASLLVLVVMAVSISIDKMLSPVWLLCQNLGVKVVFEVKTIYRCASFYR